MFKLPKSSYHNERTIIAFIWNAVVVNIVIADIPLSVTVGVHLISVGDEHAVVPIVLNAICIAIYVVVASVADQVTLNFKLQQLETFLHTHSDIFIILRV